MNSSSRNRNRREIKFVFDVEKFANVMAFLASKVSEFTILKVMKLLYLVDREHLLKYGRPILGDWYACMENGPVPSRSYDLLKEIQDTRSSSLSGDASIVAAHIKVRRVGRYPTFVSSNNIDFDSLSASEIAVLKNVVGKFGRKKPYELVEITHKHTAWKKANDHGKHQIDYRLFFEDDPECKAMLELMEIEQEDRDFISQMS